MSGMAEKIVQVKVTPEARAKVIRSALRNGKVRVKMTAGQRRALDAATGTQTQRRQ